MCNNPLADNPFNNTYLRANTNLQVAAALLLLAFSTLVSAEEDPHDHGSGSGSGDEHGAGEPCGCAAAEESWKIDCTDKAPVDAAWAELAEDGCGASEAACDANEHCAKSYRIVQAHHDHCAHDFLPTAIEQGFHVYEEACAEHACAIAKQFDANQAACPTVTCSDQVAQQAAVDALAGCEADCSSTACSDAFKTVVAFHDTCEEDDLIADIEHEIHEFEEVCEDAACNTIAAPFDAMECTEKDEITETTPKSDSSGATRALTEVVVTVAMVAIFCAV
jgi:hypothetical protein